VPMNWNVVGIQKDGTQKYGTPIYTNQRVIFQHKIAVGDWKGGVMREPRKDWPTYKHRNEVGSYRRTFTLPQKWEGREVYLNFDGVDSFFYLWINGRYVGFSKNSRNTAHFDITPYISKGKNEIALEVYRSSDGSFLEAQDMFRLPGIFRNVSVTAKPKVHIADVKAIPSYKDGNGTVSINTTLQNLTKKNVKDLSVRWSIYRNKLYSDDNELVSTFETTKEKKATAVKKPVKGTKKSVKKGKHATNATRPVVVEEIVQPVIIEVQEVKK